MARLRSASSVKCWRFYVPFGQVNFHGPKDQYFLSHRWHQVEEQCSDVRRPDAPLALVRLEPPVDLNQGSMLQVTAKVTLTPERANTAASKLWTKSGQARLSTVTPPRMRSADRTR
jgi:hypothetical protein